MFHGCPFCYPDDRNSIKHPSTSQTIKELYDATKKREKELKSMGYKVISIWEHQFRYQLDKNVTLQQFVSTLDLRVRAFLVVGPMPSNYITKLQKTKQFNTTTLPVSIPGPTSIVVTPSAIQASSRTIFKTFHNTLDLQKLKFYLLKNCITLYFLINLEEN